MMDFSEKLFSNLYEGTIDSHVAGRMIHQFIIKEGMNPHQNASPLELKLTRKGRGKVQRYEEFLSNMNWLIARTSAKLTTPFHASIRFEIEWENLGKLNLNEVHLSIKTTSPEPNSLSSIKEM